MRHVAYLEDKTAIYVVMWAYLVPRVDRDDVGVAILDSDK